MTQNQELNDRKLSELADWQLYDRDQDVRGRQLFGTSGDALGTIDDMLVDTERERVSAVLLDDGQTFPVESLEIRDEAVITYEPGSEREPSIVLYEARLVRPAG